MFRWFGRYGAWLIVLAALVFSTAVRLRLADVPLERDEGEYAYAGQLILQGTPPYELAYNMKFPGTYYAYSAVLAVFGQTTPGIREGLIVVNVATTVILFLIGRRFFGEWAAGISAATFAILSLDRFVNGTFAHATQFVLLPALGGWLVLLRSSNSRRLWPFVAAGSLFSIAVLMKQHAAVYALFAVTAVLAGDRPDDAPTSWRWRRLIALAGGLTLPLLVLGAVLAAQGVLGKFWFWTFDYARAYVSERSFADFVDKLTPAWYGVHHVSDAVWALGIVGAIALWLTPWPWRTRLTLTAWTALSFLAVCPGFYFRPHYFILLLPSVGLMTGAVVELLTRWFSLWMPVTAACAVAIAPSAYAIGQYISGERAFLFEWNAARVSREVYKRNPFVEAPEIARYIDAHTSPEDRVGILGNEPEILFYAHRKSATGYIYIYPLMEPQPFAHQMQLEMIHEVEAAHPKFLVFPGRWSWNIAPDSDTTILDWSDRYVAQCYEKVGVMDLTSLTTPAWLWDDAARSYTPQSDRLVTTYRRQSDQPCAVSR